MQSSVSIVRCAMMMADSLKKYMGVFFVILVLNACDSKRQNHHVGEKTQVTDTTKGQTPKDTIQAKKPGSVHEEMRWANKQINWYLEENKGRLTIDSQLATFFKTRVVREGRVYAMIQLGRSLGYRYQTDEWVFIDSISKNVFQYDLPKDSLIKWPQYPEMDSLTDSIPLSGVYEYDVAYAEHMGKSFGVKVTIDIFGDSVKVIYTGVGSISAKIGGVWDSGILIRHKSGVWIIGQKPEDANTDEYGGCSDGPAIIDFKNKRYWTC